MPLDWSTHFPTSGTHLWIGQRPAFSAECLELSRNDALRAPQVWHHQCDGVWLVEDSLAQEDFDGYQLVLDECVRLLGERGRLFLETRQSPQMSIASVKSFLGRRHNCQTRVVAESIDDGVYRTVLEIERSNLAMYQDSSWSLGIITRGNRHSQVLAFLKSVRGQDPDNQHEILVSGPRHPELDAFGVRYVEGDYRDDLAEISRKKNDIIDAAQGANLLIVHDRYQLNPGFFDGFARFGYDFDFCTVPQFYESGETFPAYAAMPGSGLAFLPKAMQCDDYSMLLPMQYVNGGLMIGKTETLRRVRLNELLFWNQMEDVELSAEMRSIGIPPRVNVFSSAITMGVDPSDYSGNFQSADRAFRVKKSRVDALPRIWRKAIWEVYPLNLNEAFKHGPLAVVHLAKRILKNRVKKWLGK